MQQTKIGHNFTKQTPLEIRVILPFIKVDLSILYFEMKITFRKESTDFIFDKKDRLLKPNIGKFVF